MSDVRFFRPSGPFSLKHIAARIGAEAPAAQSAEILIQNISDLESAGDGDLSLFCDKRYAAALAETKASAIITTPALARHAREAQCLLFAAEPRLAFARAGHLFYPAAAVNPGIDDTAKIHPSAVIGRGSCIEAGVIIEADVRIGENCHIGFHAVLAKGVAVGDGTSIGAHSAISNALIGARADIGASCTIGGPGFGFVAGPNGPVRLLQVGRVIIGDDVSIGANCTVDRGATGDTVIGAGSALDNLVQIGHNVRLGRSCIVCGQAGVAGSTTLGDGVTVGGQAAISDHLVIGSGARIAGKSGVMRDVAPGETVAGYPAVPVRQWHRQTAGLLRMFSRKSDEPS
jgi:UDP-3-O-[3-hydroxymyristoyl] glucosamine N-acyltransferase